MTDSNKNGGAYSYSHNYFLLKITGKISGTHLNRALDFKGIFNGIIIFLSGDKIGSSELLIVFSSE